MLKSIYQRLPAHSGRALLLAVLGGLSACESGGDGANVSFTNTVDQDDLSTNIVPDSPQWIQYVDEGSTASAEFSELASSTKNGTALRAKINNIDTDSLNTEAADENAVIAGIEALSVTPGGTYNVSTVVQGPKCGFGKFLVKESGSDDPDKIYTERKVFFDGGLQLIDYYFEVPADSSVTSVDFPVILGYPSNMSGEIVFNDFLAIPSPIPSGSGGENVVPNGSFEDLIAEDITSNNDNWRGTNFNTNADIDVFLDETVAQEEDGQKSIRIELSDALPVGDGGPPPNPWNLEGGPIVPIEFDGLYTFSVWARAAEGSAGAIVNYLVQHPTAYNVFAESGQVSLTEEWQQITFEASITGATQDGVRLFTQLNFAANAGKTIYVDNYELIPPPECPFAPSIPHLLSENTASYEYNHVTNGSLEASATDTAGWLTQANETAASFEITQALANEGVNSLEVTIEDASGDLWAIQAGPNNIYVEPGKTYSYSGFGYGPTGTQAKFTVALQSEPYTEFASEVALFDGYWQQVSFDFTVPSDTPTLTAEELSAAGLPGTANVARIHMPVQMSYASNVGSKIFLDDFLLLPNAAVEGDFENATLDSEGNVVGSGWTWNANDLWLTTYTGLLTEGVHNGAKSLRFDVLEVDLSEIEDEDQRDTLEEQREASPLQIWDAQVGIADIPVVEGRKYYVSARIKGDSGTKAALVFGESQAPYTTFGSVGTEDVEPQNEGGDGIPDGVELTGDWQEIYVEGVIPAGVTSAQVMFQLGFEENFNETFHVDSIKVISQRPVDGNLVSANTDVFNSSVVSNGGLEASATEATGWSGYDNSTGMSQFGVDTTTVHSGSNAYKVTVATPGPNSYDIEAGPDAIPVTAGSSYIFSGWVNGTAGATANVTASLGVNPYTTFGSELVTLDGTWKQTVFEFQIPSDAAFSEIRSRVQVSYEGNDNAEVYVDDIALMPTAVTNGDFESSEVNMDNANAPYAWYVNVGELASSSISNNAENAHSGTRSLRIDFNDIPNSDEPWGVQPGSAITVEAGQTYIFSARVKGDSGMRAKFLLGLNVDPYSEFGNITVDVNSQWQEVTFEATLPADVDVNTVQVAAQLAFTDNANKTMYLDSFKAIPKSSD